MPLADRRLAALPVLRRAGRSTWDLVVRRAHQACLQSAEEVLMAPPGNKNGLTHGWSRTPEYTAWVNMLRRCNSSNHPQYKDYGQRGILVCERWRKFEAFIADMGARPSSEHTLDRKNNDGNYTPDNCRWATRKEQQRNRRVYFASLAREAERLGIKYPTLWARLYRKDRRHAA
jgi:hypothetical protein